MQNKQDIINALHRWKVSNEVCNFTVTFIFNKCTCTECSCTIECNSTGCSAITKNDTKQNASCTYTTFNSCCNGCGYPFTSKGYLLNILNAPVDCWDVSKVTNMFAIFYGAAKFNQPLNHWNVSSITDMSGMFHVARSFNQALDSHCHDIIA
jgi:surface protein